ncbi:MAG: PspC domain-containing protein [Bacteroidales bacterium]|nr:PspC domain-containing protein [Bacteroidales bacterium]
MSDYKKLYRTRDKKICGVCGGIANYFDLDPTIIRLLWIIFGFISCATGVIAYFICALVIPEEP